MIERFQLGSRSYLAVKPSLPGRWPVIVMLHGAGGTAKWTLQETRWADRVDADGFMLILPEATREDQSSPAGFLVNPQVWNDGAREAQPKRPPIDDVAFLLQVLQDVEQRFEIDAARTYFTGFSNGAAMVFRFAMEQPTRVSAIAPVSGYCYVTPSSKCSVPTLYVVGREDPLVPIRGGEIVSPWGRTRLYRPPLRDSLSKWAIALGCESHPQILEKSVGVTIESYRGTVPFLTYFLDDHGHHWPGGRGELLQRIAGPVSTRLDANALITQFFFQKSATRT